MKFLCLAYGDEEGWNSLSESEKQEVLAQDEVIRNRGNFMTAVKPEVTTIKNWDKNIEVEKSTSVQGNLPLAGFSIIEADNVEEVITMISNTPCARAKGYIEVRPFWDFGNENA